MFPCTWIYWNYLKHWTELDQSIFHHSTTVQKDQECSHTFYINGITLMIGLDYTYWQFQYCGNMDCSVHYTLEKENSKQPTFFFKIFLFLIYYCFSSNFTSLFNICFMGFLKWNQTSIWHKCIRFLNGFLITCWTLYRSDSSLTDRPKLVT